MKHKPKITLMTLPFLTPLIPPHGLSCLKGFLEAGGFPVTTVDGMADVGLREACYRYFDRLEECVPVPKRGYFLNVGLDVLYNHFMVHLNRGMNPGYLELVKLVIYRNFYVSVSDGDVADLDAVANDFFQKLETFMIKTMGDDPPDMLGFSVFRGTLAPSLFGARLVKERWPRTETWMGGCIFSQDLLPGTPNFDHFLSAAPYVDKVFIGEGEQLLLSYLRGELATDRRVYGPEDTGGRPVALDQLPLPDYTDFDLGSYPLLGSYTSRGCVYKCSFCAETLFWKKYNRKSPQNAADQLEQLADRYNRRLFVLTDCLINPLVNDLSEELIRRGRDLYWDVTIKVDKRTGDPHYTGLWRRGGLYRVRLGIESGSQHLLDLIDKRITLQQIKDSLAALAGAGIKTTVYLIAGHPGETEADFQQTLDLVEEMQDYIYDAECNPFRFFYDGQVNAGIWGNKTLLYPEDVDNLLLAQVWTLKEEPRREVIYERVCRLKEHCTRLGIPNPYSLTEIDAADRRWKRLHKNAVPSLMELSEDGTDRGKEHAVTLTAAEDTQDDDDRDFNF